MLIYGSDVKQFNPFKDFRVKSLPSRLNVAKIEGKCLSC